MRITGSGVRVLVPKFTPLNASQAAPVQNTWYTALNTINAELVSVAIGVLVTGETMEIRITIDGTVILTSAGIAINANEFSVMQTIRFTNPAAIKIIGAVSGANTDLSIGSNYQPMLRGAQVKIEYRKTTAAGAGDIKCIGIYAKW